MNSSFVKVEKGVMEALGRVEDPAEHAEDGVGEWIVRNYIFTTLADPLRENKNAGAEYDNGPDGGRIIAEGRKYPMVSAMCVALEAMRDDCRSRKMKTDGEHGHGSGKGQENMESLIRQIEGRVRKHAEIKQLTEVLTALPQAASLKYAKDFPVQHQKWSRTQTRALDDCATIAQVALHCDSEARIVSAATGICEKINALIPDEWRREIDAACLNFVHRAKGNKIQNAGLAIRNCESIR